VLPSVLGEVAIVPAELADLVEATPHGHGEEIIAAEVT
jgi:hypothetical protein